MRFSQLRIRLGQILHKLQHRSLIRMTPQQGIQLHEGLPDILLVRSKRLLKVRLGVSQARLVDHQSSHHLTRLLRAGISGQPDAGSLQRGTDKTPVPRRLGRPLRDTRVARLARQFEVRLHRDVDLAALQGDIGE